MSTVTDIPAASSAQAIAHFQQRLNMETDCSDVHSAMAADDKDFVLLHVVGSAESFSRCHIPGAIHLPHRLINTESLKNGHRTHFLSSIALAHTVTGPIARR